MPCELADHDHLLRRIPPWHQAQPYQTEDGRNRLRPPSDAFALEPEEDALSFHCEQSLREAGEPPSFGCPPGEPGWAVCRVSVATLRQLGLEPRLDHALPHHVLVFGLRDLSKSARRRRQKDIALACEYVIHPMVG